MNARKQALASLKEKVRPWGHEIVDVIHQFDEIIFVIDDGREAIFTLNEALTSMGDLERKIEQRLIPLGLV